MTAPPAQALRVFAPAKINLNLQVTGRRGDGYHLLDSLVAFADIGDEITLSPARDFSFRIKGPFAESFSAAERAPGLDCKNLAVRAALALAQWAKKPLLVTITLTKNLPLGAGLGGGSADAASVLRALAEYWGINVQAPEILELATTLGADVPVCLRGHPARIRGIGERIEPLVALPEMPAILVHPGKPCATHEVFGAYHQPFSPERKMPPGLGTVHALMTFLQENGNDLTAAATEIIPDIAVILEILDAQPGCALARMSGSGSGCFGIFVSAQQAQAAVSVIKAAHPHWWVQNGLIMGASLLCA
ncbi:MAG: 4-(cytidine 5'-diphospho)-2-C-methyl-D-erythritol kinase [Alphaproteobacteria bacterium]|nr:4-(cytidine 5'-diphospho)-2-C-methyl-D-erythritol kinase [Alphaproteobacteria bacterium]